MGQGRDFGNSTIRRSRERMRSYSHSLNPLARVFVISLDANSLMRQGRALLRSNGSPTASCLLTAFNSYQSNASRNAHELRTSYPSRRYTCGLFPTGVHLPPPRSQTLGSHRTVLPGIMLDRTRANSHRTSLMLSFPSGLSRQTFANPDFRWTGPHYIHYFVKYDDSSYLVQGNTCTTASQINPKSDFPLSAMPSTLVDFLRRPSTVLVSPRPCRPNTSLLHPERDNGPLL